MNAFFGSYIIIYFSTIVWFGKWCENTRKGGGFVFRVSLESRSQKLKFELIFQTFDFSPFVPSKLAMNQLSIYGKFLLLQCLLIEQHHQYHTVWNIAKEHGFTENNVLSSSFFETNVVTLQNINMFFSNIVTGNNNI